MRQRKPTTRNGFVQTSEWRRTYARLESSVVNGVLVKIAPNLHTFEACQYVACTDSLRLIVQAGSGAVAAFQYGEFQGWHTSISAAVEAIKAYKPRAYWRGNLLTFQ